MAIGQMPNSFLSKGNKAPIKLILEVVLQAQATQAIMTLTQEGKIELKITLTNVAKTIGNTQYPKTHIVYINDLIIIINNTFIHLIIYH